MYICNEITDEGKVFSWGHGGHGQLGHSSIQNQKIPLAIDLIADQRVVYIACGGSSSAAVTGKISHHIISKILPSMTCFLASLIVSQILNVHLAYLLNVLVTKNKVIDTCLYKCIDYRNQHKTLNHVTKMLELFMLL